MQIQVNGELQKRAEEILAEVAITLSAPQSTFVNVLGSLGIVSKRDYDAKAYAQKPVGAAMLFT